MYLQSGNHFLDLAHEVRLERGLKTFSAGLHHPRTWLPSKDLFSLTQVNRAALLPCSIPAEMLLFLPYLSSCEGVLGQAT